MNTNGKNSAEFVLQLLKNANLIPEGFTGQIVFNIGQGCLFDVDRLDRTRIIDRRERDGQKIMLDKYFFSGNIANNTV